jgi:hypothetical protein
MAARIYDTVDNKGDELALYVSTEETDGDPFFVSVTFNDERAVYLGRGAAKHMHVTLGQYLRSEGVIK